MVILLLLEQNPEIAPEPTTQSTTEPELKVSYLWYIVQNLEYQGLSYGSWKTEVTGTGKATLTLSKSVAVANTYTGTLSASKSNVNASVGFNISETKTTMATYAVVVPAGKKYGIQWRPVYKKYKVKQDVYIDSTFMKSTYIYPLKYDHLEYRWIQL